MDVLLDDEIAREPGDEEPPAELPFEVLEKPPNIVVLPMWLMRGGVHFIGLLNTQFGDLFEFIVTAGEIDGVAPSVGTTTLRSYFEELAAAG